MKGVNCVNYEKQDDVKDSRALQRHIELCTYSRTNKDPGITYPSFAIFQRFFIGKSFSSSISPAAIVV